MAGAQFSNHRKKKQLIQFGLALKKWWFYHGTLCCVFANKIYCRETMCQMEDGIKSTMQQKMLAFFYRFDVTGRCMLSMVKMLTFVFL